MKKKTNVKKYSRKLKIKKIKCSRKILRGGSNGSPSNKKFTFSLRRDTIKQQLIDGLIKKYEFSKLEEVSVSEYISKIFRKFKYSYDTKNPINPAYKENDSVLYLKKDEVDKAINPTEVFKVYAPTNQSISIEYNDDKKFKDIGKFYEITPLELSVDTMQLAVNTKKIKISNDSSGNSYLGFVDFPSLVITEKPAGTGFSYTSREHAEWISVYEEKYDDDDKLFDLIETQSDGIHIGRHIDKKTFDSEIETINVKISKLDEGKNKDEISKLKNSKPIKKGDVKMSNEELFIKKQEEMRQLLSNKEISTDEKEKLKQRIEGQVNYRAYVNVEDEDDEAGNNKHVTTEDISWAMQNALWLEKYLEIRTDDNRLTSQELQTKIGEIYDCDLSVLDEKYIIVDDTIIIDGEEYVICGYPDKQMKEIIVSFWQDKIMRADLDKIHQEHKSNLGNLLVEFYNNNIEYSKDLFPTSITENYFKLYYKVRQQDWKYIITYFNDYKQQSKDIKYEDFEDKFKILFAEYYNKLGKIYLNKPNINIKYVFLIFKKETDKLIPAIFNFKELDIKYKSILERINVIIKKDISKIFNIINDTNYHL